MPNVNGPYGFRPSRHQTGGQIRVSEYSIASAYNTSLYKGDVVEMTGTSRNIQKAAAANVDNIGIFAGCRYVDSSGNQIFSKKWPANTTATDIVALVYDDPEIVFSVQCDTLAAADVGALGDHAAGTGDDTTGVSGSYLNVGASGANLDTTDKSFRIQRLLPRVDNAYGAYAKAEVTFAEHALSRVVAGVGGV